MSSSSWQVVGTTARLRTESLTATVDPGNPAAGLRLESVCGHAFAGTALFGIQIEPSVCPNEPAGGAAPLVDCFVRGNDFVATYAEIADRPFRTQIYWRLIDSENSGSERTAGDQAESENRAEPIVALELIVSVQTSRLDSDTALAVCTMLGAVETWRLLDAGEDCPTSEANPPHTNTSHGNISCSSTAQVAIARNDVRVGAAVVPDLNASDRPGCCLIRPIGSGPSYIEMVHPADFRQTNFEWTTDSAPVVRLTHRLFTERLEKGVILRSRIRGLFVPRKRDSELARSEYRRFAASEPL